MALNISTEAVSRASGQRPWLTVGVWAVLLAIGAALIVALLSDALTTEFDFTSRPESKRAYTLMEERSRDLRKANEIVIVRSETVDLGHPDFEAYVRELHGDISALGSDMILPGPHYYLPGASSLGSQDRKTTIMPFVMEGSFSDATDNIEKVLEIVHKADKHPEFEVLIAGDASISKEFNEIAEKDLQTGEGFAIPVAFVILVLVFGAVLAALIPVLLAIVSITLALAIAALIGQVFQLSFFVVNMVTMMGLAVGIDYSLFIVARYREERAKGLEKIDAIAEAGATASRAVFFSGMTVVLALIGMVIVPTTVFQSLGVGAIVVVIVSVAASLTLLPAVLALLGDKVNALRVPIVGRRLARQGAGNGEGGGFWDWVTRAVMRRPVISLVLTAGLLLAAAVPYLDMETGTNDVSTLPDSLDAKKAFALLEREFSFGLVAPAYVVIDGDRQSDWVSTGIERLGTALANDPAFITQPPPQVEWNPAGDLALVAVPVAGSPGGDLAVDAIHRLRGQHVPGSFPGNRSRVLVTGITAFNIDFSDLTDDYMPIVFAVVLGFSFVLLTIVFRSIVIPIKAIIMNLLSVGAAYGIVVLVTQKGVGADLLGFQQSDVIDAWIPLFLFSVLFGLSMDYHVFLLSRIRERYDQTQDNPGSVAYGLRTTAGLITGAALIMVAVFGGFAAGDLVMFQQVGFGLAVAVFLDATIVRSVLVPASMRLLGTANWYLPAWLSWLPDVRVEAQPLAGADASDD